MMIRNVNIRKKQHKQTSMSISFKNAQVLSFKGNE